MVISDFDVPLLGLEENSADTIAAVSLILLDREYPEMGFSSALGASALVQAYVWQTGIERDHAGAMLWAQHGLSAQRFARIVCLLYGSDMDRFGWVAEFSEMSELRAEGCEDEWQAAENGLRWLLGTVIPERPAADTEDATGVEIRHGPTMTDEAAAMSSLLREHEVLSRIAEMIEARFLLPESIILRATHCPVANA